MPPDPIFEGPTSKGRERKGEGMRGEGREDEGGEGRGEGRRWEVGEGREEKGGRGGLSGNVAEEAFCLKSAPGY